MCLDSSAVECPAGIFSGIGGPLVQHSYELQERIEKGIHALQR